MKRLIIGVALLCSACAGSPSAPTPAPIPQPPAIPPAAITFTGKLGTENCARAGDGYSCDFVGVGSNTGDGCATNIRGVTKTYRPNVTPRAEIGSSSFTYGTMVLRASTFTYHGSSLPVGTEDGWTYTTEFTFDSVACPQ